MAIDKQESVRALNGWSRSQGYSDFDTYIQAGGSIGECLADIERRISRLHMARTALYRWAPPPIVPPPPPIQADHTMPEEADFTIGPEALARAEADVSGEPADAENAHPQGA